MTERTMRVLHVIPSVALRYGGPSSAIVPMCQALAEQGVNPLILTTDADGEGALDVPLAELTTWQGVPALFFKRDFSESFKYSRGLARWAARHVADFDIVHIHAVLSHACLAAGSACRRARVPYVVRPLGTLAPWSLQQKMFRKRLLLMMGATRLLRGAAAIHCTSDEEKRGVEQMLSLARAIVIPLGIDRTFLDEPPISFVERERHPYVLVLSRLHQKKNLEPLIDSFLDASEGAGRTNWRLVIAGSGDRDYVASLEQRVRQRMAGDRVTFVGWVEGDQKRELVRGASLFALASLHENFGVSLLEAAAAGVPVLVSRRVDLAEAVHTAHAGWLVDTSAKSLVSGFAEALGSVRERDSRGRAARGMAENFAWPGVAARLVALYEQLKPSLSVHTLPGVVKAGAGIEASRH